MKKAIILLTFMLLIGAVLTQGLGCAADTYDKAGNKGFAKLHNKGLVEKQGLKGNAWVIKLPNKGF